MTGVRRYTGRFLKMKLERGNQWAVAVIFCKRGDFQLTRLNYYSSLNDKKADGNAVGFLLVNIPRGDFSPEGLPGPT